MSRERATKPKRDWPETPEPGDDPALDAAMAALRALDRATPIAAPPKVERAAQDLSIGMGNASGYAEGVPVATAAPRITVSRIKLDLPSELPAETAMGEIATRAGGGRARAIVIGSVVLAVIAVVIGWRAF